MARSAEETRRKLLDAAVAEFATYGISGARVERITASAGVNNALLYRYFGSKSELFDTVFGALATELVEAVPVTPDDLPAYAGALVDYYAEHPEVIRLATWYQLEPGNRPPPETIRKSLQDTIARIEEAQAAGRLTTTYPAADLYSIVISLAHTATDAAPVRPGHSDGAPLAERKRIVTAAVAAILAS
jgi:AcrR family transcriptional regulator